jgi:rod shape-determining protein MreC
MTPEKTTLENLLREDDAQIGDVVVTSGLGQRFPASIVIGRISKVIKRDHGLYQEVEVTPAVNFSRIEEALILTAGSRGQHAQEQPLPGDDPLTEG